jgi:hypothetical protein
VIGFALVYASDTALDFPSQIAPGVSPGGAPLIYSTSKYPSAGFLFPNYPFLKQVEAEARRALQLKFEQQFKLFIDASRLLELSLSTDKDKTGRPASATRTFGLSGRKAKIAGRVQKFLTMWPNASDDEALGYALSRKSVRKALDGRLKAS